MAGMADPNQIQQDSKKAGLDALLDLLGDDMTRVNEIILENMQSPVSLIPQLAGHIIAAGGKRLRPLLVLASARLCGAEGERQMALAACVEFIHTATLLHDDVVDESDLRRGQASAKAVWGNQASVLVGDFLFSRSFQLMVADGSLKVLKLLSDTAATLAEGEVHQLMTANDTETNEEAYLEVVRAKTASLFAASCQVGAQVAERPDAEEEALRRFGGALGMAFQLVDDILDYTAEVDPKLGKSVGDDFREGKITLPVILAFERGDETEKAFWRRCLEEQDIRDGDLEQALQLLVRHNALEDAKTRAFAYAGEARAAMEIFPESEIRSALLESVDFCVERLY
ncbi:polyprenyl synthetase family protein [Fodinicurvata sediminis]|uniref:polyprenyl synthetase family protein n=1 Tax=Fodinicurvata sediminis TaxID=1121832 RepID=UPI0003B2F633|nr:polyprenyl synthetase family protein [Fodinicurvata sediminis]